MEHIVYKKDRKETFESPYTDAQAIEILKGSLKRGYTLSSFANDLVNKAEEGINLSSKQMAWVHKLALDTAERTKYHIPSEITNQTRVPGSHRYKGADDKPIR